MPTREHCKYLGFHVGPGKGHASWHAPMKKYHERIGMWQDMPLGLHWDARVYNIFVLPVLGYVAQLEEPPQWVLTEVEDSLSRAAKGPSQWAIANDLWSLEESFGQACSFKKLDTYALAAQARVLAFDRACQPPNAFMAVHRDILRCIREGDNMQNMLRWHNWYENAFIIRLFKTKEIIRCKVGSLEQIRQASRLQHTEPRDDSTWKRRCQGTIYKAIRAQEAEMPWARIRHKLARFKLLDYEKHSLIPGAAIQLTPAWQSQRTWWLLKMMARVTPPRVQAAAFSTVWNRWTTSARFQHKRVLPCLLCGLPQGDRLEHYCRCEVARNVCRRQLNVDPSIFATLHAFTLATPLVTQRSSLACLGLLIYAVYRTVNCVRHRCSGTPISIEDAYEAVAQAVREGAKGHSFASKTLRERWIQHAQVQNDAMPDRSHLPFDGVLKRYRDLGHVTRQAKRQRIQQ